MKIRTTRIISKKPAAISKSAYQNTNRYRRQQLKANLLQQVKIKRLLIDSKIDKKKIAELEKELKELQRSYNQLDDESIPPSKI